MSNNMRVYKQDKIGIFMSLVFTLILIIVSGPYVSAEQISHEVNENRSNALDSLSVDHLLLGVTNFEETIEWYKEKLGFEEELRWKVESLPDLDLAYLKKNNFRIEIIGTSKPRQGPDKPSDFAEHLRTQGFNHLCFEVDNVDTALSELNSRGVPTFIEAATYPLGPFQRRVGFVLDNNGNVIEFAGPLIKGN